MPEADDERKISLSEEHIHVGKARVVSDQLRVTTNVEERPVLIEDVVERGSLKVDRIAVDRAVTEPPEPRHEGDTLIVCVVEERLVVEKRLFVVEELRITRTSSLHDVAIPETVRTMRASIERMEPTAPTGETLMADSKNTQGEPPREIHIEKKKTNWLAWILLALGILAALLALSMCNRRQTVAAAPAPAGAPSTPPVAVEHVTLPGGKVVDLQPATLNYDLQAFLASSDAAPRTFTFDKLNFDTASSQIRADDQPTLSALSQILTAYPKAAVKLVGYADARGSDATNDKLGADRATAVAKSLADGGIDPKRITTASGGDSNPVGSNATAGGQFENRRTELVVTSK